MSTLKIDQALQIDKWANDPWLFIKDCCWTMDEADEGKVKQFPNKPYLKYVCEVWQRESLLAIPKTRRMMLTWIMLALHLWAALFKPNSAIFVQSKKADDSDFLIGDKRMMFLYNNLPKEYPWPKCSKKQYNLQFDNGSYVMAIGQGADQLRQYTASYAMLDEFAFWESAEDTWGALKPIIQGGGRVTLISSAGPGFFQRIVEGDL
jgi:phage FluMu gp28-like protein